VSMILDKDVRCEEDFISDDDFCLSAYETAITDVGPISYGNERSLLVLCLGVGVEGCIVPEGNVVSHPHETGPVDDDLVQKLASMAEVGKPDLQICLLERSFKSCEPHFSSLFTVN